MARPDMTEKLFTGTLSKKRNKTKNFIVSLVMALTPMKICIEVSFAHGNLPKAVSLSFRLSLG